MDETTSRPVRFTSFLLCILLSLCFSSSSTDAASLNGSWAASGNTESILDDLRPQEFFGAVAVVHSFAGAEMKETYGQMYGVSFMGGQQFPSGAGWRIEGGLFFAEGDPLVSGPTSETDTLGIAMAVVPFGGSVLYHFTRGERGRTFVPYVGFGLEGRFGFERTTGKISRFGVDYDWADPQYRYAWSGHVLVGATFSLLKKVRGVVEIGWTQGLDGSDV